MALCVIGNKVDLRMVREVKSCVSPAHGEKLARVRFLFCCAERKF